MPPNSNQRSSRNENDGGTEDEPSLTGGPTIQSSARYFDGLRQQSNVGSRLLFPLVAAARLGATKTFIELSTKTLGDLICQSQQTASRLLAEASDLGLVERMRHRTGLRVKITPSGIGYLERMYHLIDQALAPLSQIIEVTGSVFTGLGQGQYYMSREPYVECFNKALGWVPYPGTLNLRLSSASDQQAFLTLKGAFPHVIEQFELEGRMFGGVLVFPVLIENITNAALVVPIRTHWGNDTAEIISDVCLRKALGLADDSQVTFIYDMS